MSNKVPCIKTYREALFPVAGATATGVGLSIDSGGISACIFRLTGTWVATVQFEGNLGDGTWVAIPVMALSGGALSTTATTTGDYLVAWGCYQQIRVNVTAYTSGTVNGWVSQGEQPASFPPYVTVSAAPIGPIIPPSGSTSALSRAKQTAAYAASLVVKASAGRLYSISGYNSNSADQFVMLFNATALPANATAPEYIIVARAQSNWSYDFNPVYGVYFSTGIVAGNSTGAPTLTTGAADCTFSADYV